MMLGIIIAILLAIVLGPPALVVLGALLTGLCKAVFFILVSPIILVVWLHDKARGIKRRYF